MSLSCSCRCRSRRGTVLEQTAESFAAPLQMGTSGSAVPPRQRRRAVRCPWLGAGAPPGVLHELLHDVPQAALAADREVVETLGPQGPYPALWSTGLVPGRCSQPGVALTATCRYALGTRHSLTRSGIRHERRRGRPVCGRSGPADHDAGAGEVHPPSAPYRRRPLGAVLSILSLLAFAVASALAIVLSRGGPGGRCSRSGSPWPAAPSASSYETVAVPAGGPYRLLGHAARAVSSKRCAGAISRRSSARRTSPIALLTYGTTDQAGWLILRRRRGDRLPARAAAVPRADPGRVLRAHARPGRALVLLWTAHGRPGRRHRAGGCSPSRPSGCTPTILIGSQTPVRSTIFHVVGTAVVALLYFGSAGRVRRAAGRASVTTAVWSVAVRPRCPPGIWLAFRLYPNTWAVFRSMLANLSSGRSFYLVIAGGMRIPKPNRLSDPLRGPGGELRPLTLYPYYYAHPRNLTHPISVPRPRRALTVKVQRLGFITQLVKFVFGLASAVGPVLPIRQPRRPARRQAADGALERRHRVLAHLAVEAHLHPGARLVPDRVRRPRTGLPAVARHGHPGLSEGALLAFLVEYGIAGLVHQGARTRERPKDDPFGTARSSGSTSSSSRSTRRSPTTSPTAARRTS